MFLAVSTYTAPPDVMSEHRPAHLAFLEELTAAGRLVTAGRQEPPIGGVLVLTGTDPEEVAALVARDPYSVAGVGSYALTRFAAAFGQVRD
ncbi:MAG: hypothetical protein JWM48_1029 [Mycobacterium sp.]|jgi:hypothetical protein|nr:hypothetical protein [Mycobacterium sp.]MCW2744479.1 hypothetical protein [Mycobacterium sp.]